MIMNAKSNNMKAAYFILPCIGLLLACQSQQTSEIIDDTNSTDLTAETSSSIQPLNFKNNQRVFKVSGTEATIIDLENGGSIEFPENAFVDAVGNPIKGKVDVEWEEFHTLGDIIASGIPMKYDSSGVAFDFVSGGMFTINASQKGKPVELADGKSATVNVASISDTPCFNFYELDEESGDWSYETTKEGEKVPEPGESASQEVKETIIDQDYDVSKFQDLAGVEIIGWKTKDRMDPLVGRVLSSPHVKSRLIEENGGYAIEYVNGNETRTIHVDPYTMEDAINDSKKNSQELAQEVSEELAYLQKVAAGKVIRSIQIENFGTYNWDIAYKRENSKMIASRFNFPDVKNSKLLTVYLISPDEDVVVKYDPSGRDPFSFDPDMRNCLVAITPDNKLLTVSNEGFSDARAAKDNKTIIDFNFEKTGITLKSSTDIMNYLDRLI